MQQNPSSHPGPDSPSTPQPQQHANLSDNAKDTGAENGEPIELKPIEPQPTRLQPSQLQPSQLQPSQLQPISLGSRGESIVEPIELVPIAGSSLPQATVLAPYAPPAELDAPNDEASPSLLVPVTVVLTTLATAAATWWLNNPLPSIAVVPISGLFAYWISRWPLKEPLRTPLISIVTLAIIAVLVQASWTTLWQLVPKILLEVALGALTLLTSIGLWYAGHQARQYSLLSPAEKAAIAYRKRLESAKENLKATGFVLGCIGLWRCYDLWGIIRAFDTDSWWHLMTSLTGPIILIASVLMTYVLSWPVCVIGSLLCTASGNIIAILLGFSAFRQLQHRDTLELFRVREQASGRSTSQQSLEFFRRVHARIRSSLAALSGFLLNLKSSSLGWLRFSFVIAHLACMLMIAGFNLNYSRREETVRNTFSMGSRKPWFVFEQQMTRRMPNISKTKAAAAANAASSESPVADEPSASSASATTSVKKPAASPIAITSSSSMTVSHNFHWKVLASIENALYLLGAFLASVVVWEIEKTKPIPQASLNPTFVFKSWAVVILFIGTAGVAMVFITAI